MSRLEVQKGSNIRDYYKYNNSSMKSLVTYLISSGVTTIGVLLVSQLTIACQLCVAKPKYGRLHIPCGIGEDMYLH